MVGLCSVDWSRQGNAIHAVQGSNQARTISKMDEFQSDAVHRFVQECANSREMCKRLHAWNAGGMIESRPRSGSVLTPP